MNLYKIIFVVCVLLSFILLMDTMKYNMGHVKDIKESMINQSFEYEYSIEDVSGAINDFVTESNNNITNISSNFDDIIADISNKFMP